MNEQAEDDLPKLVHFTTDAAWQDVANGLEVYAESEDGQGSVRVSLPSVVNLSPKEALAFSRALVIAANVVRARGAE